MRWKLSPLYLALVDVAHLLNVLILLAAFKSPSCESPGTCRPKLHHWTKARRLLLDMNLDGSQCFISGKNKKFYNSCGVIFFSRNTKTTEHTCYMTATHFGDWSKLNWPNRCVSLYGRSCYVSAIKKTKWLREVISLAQVERNWCSRILCEFLRNKADMTKRKAGKAGRLMVVKRNEKDLLIGEACGGVRLTQKHHKCFIHFEPLIQSLIGIKCLALRAAPYCLFIPKAIFHSAISA